MTERKRCKCGRSPTGYCIGWHTYNEEKLKEAVLSFNNAAKQMGRPQFTPKVKK